MAKKPEEYNNAELRKADGGKGWVTVSKARSAKTPDALGYDFRLLAGSFLSGPAWRHRETGVWSACILDYRGITTTLLAKSFSELERLYRTLHKRCDGNYPWDNRRLWQQYYQDIWRRRYKRWCCKRTDTCDCQLCRMVAATRAKHAKKKVAKKKAKKKTKKRKKRRNG